MGESKLPQVGDLVMYQDPEYAAGEYLFKEPNNLDPEHDFHTLWSTSDGPGIVLEFRHHPTGSNLYPRVKILAGEKIGWCYADYVEVLG